MTVFLLIVTALALYLLLTKLIFTRMRKPYLDEIMNRKQLRLSEFLKKCGIEENERSLKNAEAYLKALGHLHDISPDRIYPVDKFSEILYKLDIDGCQSVDVINGFIDELLTLGGDDDEIDESDVLWDANIHEYTVGEFFCRLTDVNERT